MQTGLKDRFGTPIKTGDRLVGLRNRGALTSVEYDVNSGHFLSNLGGGPGYQCAFADLYLLQDEIEVVDAE